MKKISVIAMTLSFLGFASNINAQSFVPQDCSVICPRKYACETDAGRTYAYLMPFTDHTSPAYPNCSAVQKYWIEHAY